MLTYANTMLSYYSNNAKMRTLLVDLLNYGASAQTFFGYNTANLVNKDLTEEQKGWATAEAPELDRAEGLGDCGSSGAGQSPCFGSG